VGNPVKEALLGDRVQIGTYVSLFGAPQLPLLLAQAGFDYVIIDMEHSSLSIETVGGLCLGAVQSGLMPLVRPRSANHHDMTVPMDNGAMGIYRHVDTPEDARRVVEAVKFRPDGRRGSHPVGVATRFEPLRNEEYFRQANDDSMVIAQIETAAAVERIEDILAVPGVDGASVGRGDLSIDLEVAGQQDHPDVLDRVEFVIDACRASGKIPGMKVSKVDEATRWIERGVRLVTYSSEFNLLITAAESATRRIRAAL
jgi:2-keto-3-deoxy-L-rhamnonate aldolase RhmA